MTTRLAWLSKVAGPYLPTVKDMAPNAPMGASRTSILMMAKNTFETLSRVSAILWPKAPSCEQASPVRMETSSTCSRLPSEKALTTVVGIMLSRKPENVMS